MKGVLVDLGGVLVTTDWRAAAEAWGRRLGIGPDVFLSALFGGSDRSVSIGRTPEADWWEVVRQRLALTARDLDELRGDLRARERRDDQMVQVVLDIRPQARTAVVSNSWPSWTAGLDLSGLVDEVVLSCDVGWAKPHPRIFQIALQRLALPAADVLFIDDNPDHIEAAQGLGIGGHLHTSRATTSATIERFLADG